MKFIKQKVAKHAASKEEALLEKSSQHVVDVVRRNKFQPDYHINTGKIPKSMSPDEFAIKVGNLAISKLAQEPGLEHTEYYLNHSKTKEETARINELFPNSAHGPHATVSIDALPSGVDASDLVIFDPAIKSSIINRRGRPDSRA